MTFPGSARPLIIGHRGAPGYRPEHTRSSYELAIALGADAVEPDIVATKDGVLVLRHENEISGTTDVASRPEFASRRTTKIVDGAELTGWFTEDFTWRELWTLRSRERIPALRSASATFDGSSGILRLRDLLSILESSASTGTRNPGLVVEIKHATYFEQVGLPLDELLASELAGTRFGDGSGLIVEAFEKTVLRKLSARGVRASYVYLLEKKGAPFDQVAAIGAKAPPYSDSLTDAGLDALAGDGVDGISVDKALLFSGDADGSTNDLVARAHQRGLAVCAWTLRPENAFLVRAFRSGGEPADFGHWEAEFDAVLRTGVDGVFCDHPDLGVAARDALFG
ncbi:MAG TPA: glycerophosphodiester phosphodiesterase family protein [Mycetocola sp.]|jgi:glycerophosphoryl diester phosphodiesterase|uniref:glycerophosphodiester phosphodiesterase family protein n=1 Tax=Mycetocola sp. TaxID=1871042 RepID=UPI0026262B98|nr:glycerophosphodiester phosphodiesterase family protein [Mycetocola sp.]MCU1419104.1 glycerophosphodiester phosphodiesterase [Mycetocola sp.]MCU1559438.1 glycerophosphodiester phosphodiesterase [Mycetocola sp.]HEV7849007.1 glycerophosphodiester phosphodiesterase family protein [Mycetocola sp.]